MLRLLARPPFFPPLKNGNRHQNGGDEGYDEVFYHILVQLRKKRGRMFLFADELDVVCAGMDELEFEGAGEAFVEGVGGFEAA